ncbi:MAG: PhoH family protein [Negativicutes bacterium]|nr:PhoH family protein [Negativicutes bacterium]
MIYERKIGFANRQEAVAVLGRNDEYIRYVEQRLPCEIFTRGEELVIKSAAEDVCRQLGKLFAEFLLVVRQGVTPGKPDFAYALRMLAAGRQEFVPKLMLTEVFTTVRGKVIRPRTLGQLAMLEAIDSHDITLVSGPAGTGKTYLAVARAVKALKNHQAERIILSRPVVEAGEKLGFLPGDLQDKIDPYLRPLYDALDDIVGSDNYQKMIERGVIEIAPLAYMRGRTLNDAFIILDEGQNATREQMKMFLTRFGFGSKMVVCGDTTQVDLNGHRLTGLSEAQTRLAGVNGVATVQLTADDVVRHDIVARVIEAYGD